MDIKTAKGWMQLIAPTTNKLVEAPPRYRGPLPSKDALAFIAEIEAYIASSAADRAEMVARLEAQQEAA